MKICENKATVRSWALGADTENQLNWLTMSLVGSRGKLRNVDFTVTVVSDFLWSILWGESFNIEVIEAFYKAGVKYDTTQLDQLVI